MLDHALLSRALMIAAAIVVSAATARAQSPVFSYGAMQPSTGTGVFHEMLMYRSMSDDARLGEAGSDDLIALSQISFGLRNDLSLQIDIPVVYRDEHRGSDDNINIADSNILLKYRILQDDPGPTETTRLSLLGGLQIPGNSTYAMDASHDALDPLIGAVVSTVRGRHGLNADLLYELYTGDDEDEGASDTLRYDGSYLFRLSPAKYTPDTQGALYLVAELNGIYDTNGDHELYLSPGIMYESWEYTIDAGLMIPIWQELDYRARTEIIVAVGLRISF